MAGLDRGAMDRCVRVEKAQLVDDGYNEVRQFAPVTTVWAQYLPARGSEAREALGQQATVPVTWRIAWRAAFAEMIEKGPADYQLRYPPTDDGAVFDIKSAIEIGRRDGIEIVALASDDAA